MKTNIFERAKFGDKFLTRDGRIAIYHYKQENPTNDGKYESWYNLITENSDMHLICLPNGLHLGNHIDYPEWDDDIVSRWNESIDKEELNNLANYYMLNPNTEYAYDIKLQMEAFKAGYRKAKEE